MNRTRGRAVADMDQEALGLLIAHNFPGNIRELKNIIEHAFVLCPNGLIKPHHLQGSLIPQTFPSAVHSTLDNALKSAEACTILDALKQNNYNRQAAARDFGMHKSTFSRKIKKLGITLPEIDGHSGRKVSP